MLFRLALPALLAVSCISPALLQFSSNIQGVVLDETGAVIPEATVTLLDLATGVDQSATTGTTDQLRRPSAVLLAPRQVPPRQSLAAAGARVPATC